MASSQSITPPLTPMRADQQSHVEHLMIPPPSPSPSHVRASNPAHRDRFTIPRKPVGGYSSVTVDDPDEQVGRGGPDSVPLTHQPPLEWRLLYLRRRCMISFAIIFISLLVAVEALYQLSQRWHGLASAAQRLNYLWTYGPTAVFTIVAAFWSRLEYQAKQSAPWSAMIKGPSKASNSVLLDYISPLKTTAMLVAIRNNHYLVSFGILGSLILKLIIIFSTGLMSLTRVDILRNDVNITVFDEFAGNKTALEEIGSLPWDILSGINYKNLSFPLGTNEQFVVQTFNATGIPEGSVIEATVDGFNAYLECEKAELVVESWYLQQLFDAGDMNIDTSVLSTLQVVTSSCTLSNVTMDTVGAYLIGFNSTQSWVLFQSETCDGISGNEGRRVLVSAGNLLVGPKVTTVTLVSLTVGNITTETGNFTVINSANLLCQPVYSMSRVIATTNSTDTTSQSQLQTVLAPSSKNWTLNGVEAWDILDAQTIAASQYVAEDLLIQPYPNVSVNIDKQMIQGLRLYGDSRPTLEDLFQVDVVGAVANRYFGAIGAQIASRSLLREQTASLIGSAVVYENRIFVGVLATRVIEGALAVVLILSITMLLFIPKRGLAARDPGSIFGLATILRNSPLLLSLLHRTGSLDIRGLHEKLDECVFDTSSQSRSSFGIYTKDNRLANNIQKRTTSNLIDGKLPVWEPFLVKLVGRAILFIFTTSIIVALEVLLRISQHHAGFGNAPTGGYLHYVWRYIPVILMVILGLLFTSLDFATQCLAPYSKLKTYTTFEKSLIVNSLDRLPLVAIFESIGNGHWAVTATTVAALLGSILTIVGGGVFGSASVPLTWPVQLLQQSYFTSNNSETPFNTETYGLDLEGLILYSNMSEPNWTYGELALTRLGFSLQDQMMVNTNLTLGSASINVMIPALRSKLTCRVSQPHNLNITLKFGGSVDDWFGNPLQNPLIVTSNDDNCGLCPCDYYEDQTPFAWSVKPDIYFGMAYDNPDGLPTCSNFSFSWGKLSTSSIQHIGYLSCNETAETVAVNTTLLYPGLSFDPDNPPTPDESSATPSPAILPPLEYSFNYLPNVTFDSSNDLDTFWAAAIFGVNGIPLDYLSNQANDQDVIDRIIHLHKLIRAQQFNNYTRILSNDISRLGAPIRANITDPNRLRVVQDATSTRILEGLLATMLLCAVLAGILMDTRNAVPKNPCSIAAVGSFLADSNLMDVLPEYEGAEGMVADEREMARRLGLLDTGVVFRMGWTREEGKGDPGRGRLVYGIQMVRLEEGQESGKIDEEPKVVALASMTPGVEEETD